MTTRRAILNFGWVFLFLLTAQSCTMSPETRARLRAGFRGMNASDSWDRPQQKKRESCTKHSVVYVNGQYYNVQSRNVSSECQE